MLFSRKSNDYMRKWCCDEFKEEVEDYDIEVVNDKIQFSTCEDYGIRYFPFYFRYCSHCGEKINIK